MLAVLVMHNKQCVITPSIAVITHHEFRLCLYKYLHQTLVFIAGHFGARNGVDMECAICEHNLFKKLRINRLYD